MIEVKTASSNAEVEQILRFRYQVDIEELGRTRRSADHHQRRIHDELDQTATHVYAANDGVVVGAIRRNQIADSGVPTGLRHAVRQLGFEEWGIDRLIYNSRFMVAPAARGASVTADLLQHSYAIGRDNGMLFEFLYCRPSLSAFYRRVGFRTFGQLFCDDDGVESISMVMAVPRTERLRDYKTPAADHPEAELVARASSWLDARVPIQQRKCGHCRRRGRTPCGAA